MISPFYKQKRAGFTLVEALVAITIITVAISGPLVSAANSFAAALDANNRLTASYLAQESIEYVRMLRDTAYLKDYQAGVDDLSNTAFWNDFVNHENVGGSALDPFTIFECKGNACALDTDLGLGIGSTLALQVCANGANADCSDKPLYIDSNGRYTLTNTGTPSIFTRKIQFYDFGSGTFTAGIEVVSTVTWTSRGKTNSIVLSTNLLPWQ